MSLGNSSNYEDTTHTHIFSSYTHTHTHAALHMLIEWLLMALRVNLCLVGSSGCLRGHVIKGNETS